jgi:hypothetical protein
VAVVGTMMRLTVRFLTGTALLLAIAAAAGVFVWFLFRNLFSSPIQNKIKQKSKTKGRL